MSRPDHPPAAADPTHQARPGSAPGRPELFVLRHGQTEWNLEGRHQGSRDSALTDKGRAQAERQGRILRQAGLAGRAGLKCFASPQPRAANTAVIALRAIVGAPVFDRRLQEIAFGDWEGLTTGEIDDGWPGERTDHLPFAWHFRAPGGESFAAIAARVHGFLESLTGPTVVVTHGITGRVLRGLWLGLDMNGMAGLPGGQGVVFHLSGGTHRVLQEAD